MQRTFQLHSIGTKRLYINFLALLLLSELEQQFSVGMNLKLLNLELSENRTSNLLNLGSSSETELRTSQKTEPNSEPHYIEYQKMCT